MRFNSLKKDPPLIVWASALPLTPEIMILVALLVIVGLFAGVLAGLLGVGGGIVIVPALYHVFGYLEIDPAVRMHLAVGTSLATIIPTSIRSVLSHKKKGAVDGALLKSWAAPLFVGVLLGTAMASVVDNTGLTMVFAVVALGVACHMAFVSGEWRLRDSLPKGPAGGLIPTVIGGISAMMGIGGGTLGVPTLTAFSVPIHRAVATAAGFGLIIAIPGTAGFLLAGWGAGDLPFGSVGYVNLLGFAVIVPATLLAVPWGVKIAHWLSPRPLRLAFAFFLAATSLRMFWDLFG